jgi:hypothetical protein
MRAALRAVLLAGTSTGLDLNFAGGVFSLNNTRTASPAAIPGWSFSRTDTNGTATALDLAGNVIQFATGVPRITNRGILVEEARTNKGTSHNANPTEAAGFVGNPVNMSKSGDAAGILSVVDDAAALAAAGLSNACASGKVYKLDNTAGAANAIASINGTVGNLNAHAFSCYARATAGSGSVGRSGSSVGAATFSSSAYARASAVLTPTATTEVLRVQALPGAVVYFILAQLEEGAFATSPIITTGAAGTRGADAGRITQSPTASGTIIATVRIPTDKNNRRVVGTNGASAVTPLAYSTAGIETYNGSSTLGKTVSMTAGALVTVGVTWESGRRSVTGAGLTVATDANAIGSFTEMWFGQDDSLAAGNALNESIVRVQVLPYAVTDAQLQALTAP